MRILFVVPHPLIPVDSGNKHHTLNLLRYVAKDHDIDVVGFDDNGRVGGSSWEALERMLPRVRVRGVFRRLTGWRLHAARIGLLLSLRPQAMGRYRSRGLARIIGGNSAGDHDVVCFDMITMAQHRRNCRDKPCVLLATDAYSMTVERDARVVTSVVRKVRLWAEAALLRRFEKTTYPDFDAVACVSMVDGEYLLRNQPRTRIEILPVPLEDSVARAKPRVHGTEPRHRVVCWAGVSLDSIAIGVRRFILEAWPRVRKNYPLAELLIWGKRPHSILRDVLKQPGVRHTEYVNDWVTTLRDATVFVYPQRCGAGMQTKVQSAMALGIPCVVSPETAGGLVLKHGENGFVCETPEQFAECCERLLGDEELQARVGNRAREDVRRAYSVEVVGQQLIGILQKVVSHHASANDR